MTTGYCDTVSTSGLTLKDAPEISTLNLANIANEDEVSGKQLAESKLNLAKTLIRNDFMGILAANNVLPNVNNTIYGTGTFNLNENVPINAIERGLTLITNPRTYGKLRKTTIHTVLLYPLADATGVALRIYDDYAGGIVTTYNIDLTANEVNEIDVDYVIKGEFARVVLADAPVMADSTLTTCAGCTGSMPNDCAYTKASYNGRDTDGRSGYGVNVNYSCECAYDEVLCGLSKGYAGQLVWYKARILLMEELIMSNRWNSLTTFNREDMAGYLGTIKEEYQNTWSAFTNSLPGTLKQYNDFCLICRGVRWVTNI